jgi:hypothetical protein
LYGSSFFAPGGGGGLGPGLVRGTAGVVAGEGVVITGVAGVAVVTGMAPVPGV